MKRGLWIGLTGGMGSGKSTVADLLQHLGACVVDTDAISRELTQAQGAAMPSIAEHFGASFITPDGALDRPAMRNWIFQHPQAKRQLESLLHPLITARALSQAQAAQAKRPDQVVVFDIPLLVESGHWLDRFDQVVVVDCPAELQIARVMARSGLDRAMVEGILAQQASREDRLKAADHVLDNSQTRSSLKTQVQALWNSWL